MGPWRTGTSHPLRVITGGTLAARSAGSAPASAPVAKPMIGAAMTMVGSMVVVQPRLAETAAMVTTANATSSSMPSGVFRRRGCVISSIGSASPATFGPPLLVDIEDVVVFFLGADTTGVRLGKAPGPRSRGIDVTSLSVARTPERPSR